MTTTTNTAQGLLADIIEHPEADDLRLIFADWLDDHGEEERANDIRESVAYRWPMPAGAGAMFLRRYHRDIVDLVVPQGASIPDVLRVRRGFVAEVHAPLAVLQQHLPALVRQHPIERVRATDKEPEFFKDLSNPWTWWRHGCRASSISPDLWEKLDGYVVSTVDSVSSGRDYPTAEAAHAALSVALLKMARR